MIKANNYIREMRNAIGNKLIKSGIYEGREGHLKLAREIGYALTDFNDEEIKHIKGLSYGSIYVICCNLKPILDAKEWIEGLTEGHKRAIEDRTYNGEKLYNEIELLSEVGNIYWRVKLDFQDLKLTKEETIEIYDEIIRDYNIKNITEFRDEMEKIDAELKKIESESPRNSYDNCH